MEDIVEAGEEVERKKDEKQMNAEMEKIGVAVKKKEKEKEKEKEKKKKGDVRRRGSVRCKIIHQAAMMTTSQRMKSHKNVHSLIACPQGSSQTAE